MHVFTSVCSRYLSRFFLDNNFPAINNYLHEIWFPRSCAGLCYVLGWPNLISHPAAQFLKQLMILHLNLDYNRCIFNPIFVLLILHIPCWHLSNALNLILVMNLQRKIVTQRSQRKRGENRKETLPIDF